MSAQGMRVEMGSLTTLFSGGVSFDVPTGWELGERVQDRAQYQLFDNERSIQDSLYTEYKEYVMFFDESIRGLQVGAPVEFRGIRLGTVAQAPLVTTNFKQDMDMDYRIPVLIRVEPARFKKIIGKQFDYQKQLADAQTMGLRASLKTANLLSGALFIDLDFYPKARGNSTGPLRVVDGYPVLPQDMQQTLQELNRSMQGMQPGSPAYNRLVANMQRLNQVLRELQPVLRTLNDKSNALIFQAPESKDSQPKRAKP